MRSKLVYALLIAAVVLAINPSYPEIQAVNPGAKPQNYGGCYPYACVGYLDPSHWPFGGTPPLAVVASGSPAFGDLYSIISQIQYLGLNQQYYDKIRKITNQSTAIRVGFTQFGEYVAMLNGGTAGGISMAFYNRPDMFARYESWATNNIPYINPSDWVNGWTLSANFTTADGTHFIAVQMYAVYSNRTHAGGGRGVVVYYNKSGPPAKWPSASQWKWYPLQSTPLQVVYDSPRLLIARGSSYFIAQDVGQLVGDQDLTGFQLWMYVNYTLVFPKAFPYAVVYYNWTVVLYPASKLIPTGGVIKDVAFSLRFELDQLNARNYALTANVTVFPVKFGTNAPVANLTLAVPTAPYNNVTFFALVYPGVTEYNVTALPWLVPSTLNNYQINLPTGERKPSANNTIPFVILQYKTSPNWLVLIGEKGVVSGGHMFVYGMTFNVTNWVANNQPDPYIVALLNYTLFNLRQYPGGWIVAPSRGHMADVLGLGWVQWTNASGWLALDVAPLGYGTVDPMSMAPFVYNGSIPVLLYPCSSSAPWYVDSYGRVSLVKAANFRLANQTTIYNKTIPVAGTRVTSVAGPLANLVTRYMQDFAWWSPFLNSYSGDFFNTVVRVCVTGCGGLKSGNLVVQSWNNFWQPVVTTTWPPQPGQVGYGVISVSVDPNGTVLVQVWGANAQDTYWTAYIFYQLQSKLWQNLPPPIGTYVVQLYYNYMWPGYPTIMPKRAVVYFVSPTQHVEQFLTPLTPGP